MPFEEITYDVDAGRAYIRFNRPEKLNALTPLLLQELNDALWEADDDRRVHAVCISGTGRCFSAGYDLGGAAVARRPSSSEDGPKRRSGATFDDDIWFLERAQRLRMVLFDMHKPVIAKVHGYCLAGGTDIALLTDFIICSETAKIGFPATRANGTPPNQLWIYHVGPQWAKRLMMTGDNVWGRDAVKIGLAL